MTIVAGFRCKDGLVICADQQISLEHHHKYYERKIFIEEGAGWVVAMGYSGSPSLAKEAREKIAKALHQLPPPDVSAQAVLDIADEVLTGMGRQYVELELQLLIATSSMTDTPELLKFDGKGLHVADDFNCLGVGDTSLIRYLHRVLYSPKHDINFGATFGVYLIEKAKLYVDHCGGPTDVVTVGNAAKFDLMKSWNVEAIAKKLESEESLMRSYLIWDGTSSTLL